MKPIEFPDLMHAFAMGKAYAVMFNDKFVSYHYDIAEAKNAMLDLQRQGHTNVKISTINGVIDDSL